MLLNSWVTSFLRRFGRRGVRKSSARKAREHGQISSFDHSRGLASVEQLEDRTLLSSRSFIGFTLTTDDEDKVADFVKRTGAFFKPSEWNQIRIRCEGSRIQTWINGQLCSDLQDKTHTRGAIGLQHHNETGTYRFRNIRIRKIGSAK